MTRLRRRGVSPFSFLAAVCLIVFTSMAQTTATERLVQLLKTDDPTSAMAEILQTTIDAGPPAISSLEPLISGTSNQRLFALGSIALIGGEPALAIVRQHTAPGRYGTEDLTPMLAAALASVDSPQNRQELIQLLSPERGEETNRLAAVSLAILREKDALPALRTLRRTKSIADDPGEIDLALDWIQTGYWTTPLTPSTEKGRIVAAVLRVGIPNLRESDEVIVEDSFWKHDTLGWVQAQGKPATPQNSPVLDVHIGTEGSRAMVFARNLTCGGRCRRTHVIFLRKENSTWKVQTIGLNWPE